MADSLESGVRRVPILGAVIGWLASPAHWAGSDGIGARVLQHLALSGTALAIAVAVAMPLGLYLGHTGKGALLVINVANAGRALPSLAVLALVLPLVFRLHLGLGFWPTVFMLIPLGVPLILLNCYVALRSVERELLEVARAMGMREWQVLREVELPVASLLILAGIRNAAVTIVATATLGALVASGGLGRYLVDGLARQETERLIAGALLVALLSTLTEIGFGLLEQVIVPRGIRHRRHVGQVATQSGTRLSQLEAAAPQEHIYA